MNESPASGMRAVQILRIVIFFLLIAATAWLLYTIRSTLAPFLIAFVLSYLLMPLVDFLESYRVNRRIAVAGVLLAVFAIVIIPLVVVAPRIARGTEDLVQHIIGDQETWLCVVENPGAIIVAMERFESTLDDFKAEGLPIKLMPGERDTLHMVFSPQETETRRALLNVYGSSGGRDGIIAMTLVGNDTASVSGAVISEPTQKVRFGRSEILLSATQHVFGSYKPGYFALVKSYTKTLRTRVEEWIPLLKGNEALEEITARFQIVVTNFFKQIPRLIGQVLSGLTFVIIVPLVLFFFLGEGRAIKRALIELVPNRYFELVLNLLYRIEKQLGGYIRGMVLSVAIVSLLSSFLLWLIGLEHFLVIGLFAGLANVIPYLGPVVGIVAGVIAAILQYSALSAGIIVPVVVVFLIVQAIDNVFVAPVVVARSVNLHPLLVIFAVLVGSQLFGAVGMLLAIPATAVLKVSAQTIYEGLRRYSA